MKPPGPTPYTEKQMQILNGEIPLESVDSRALLWFYKKALSNHDVDLAQAIKERIDILKEEAYRRKIKRVIIRERKVRNLCVNYTTLLTKKSTLFNILFCYNKNFAQNNTILLKVYS